MEILQLTEKCISEIIELFSGYSSEKSLAAHAALHYMHLKYQVAFEMIQNQVQIEKYICGYTIYVVNQPAPLRKQGVRRFKVLKGQQYVCNCYEFRNCQKQNKLLYCSHILVVMIGEQMKNFSIVKELEDIEIFTILDDYLKYELYDLRSPDLSYGNEVLSPGNKIPINFMWRSSANIKTLQLQVKERETLQKCVHKIRQFTQIKQYNSLLPAQFQVIDDQSSELCQPISQKPMSKTESQFEHKYQQSKINLGKLKSLVMNLVGSSKKKLYYTLRPSNPFLIFWNMLKVMLMVHIFFIFPLNDSFGDVFIVFLSGQLPIFVFEWIYLMIDLVVRFNVQIYKNGELITSYSEIAKYYIKSGFFVDVLGLIGFTFFLFYDRYGLRYLFFLKFPELKKLLRFLRKELDAQNNFKNHITILKLLLIVVVLCHLIVYIIVLKSCVWIAVGRGSSEKSWIKQRGIQDDDWLNQYICAFYFCILTMTTVGYGDIVPVNQSEMVTCIAIILLSSGIFAYTLNTITQVLKDIDYDKSRFKEESQLINTYMLQKGIDSDLQRRIYLYMKQMQSYLQRDKLEHQQNVINKLSSQLQHELHMQDRGSMLLKVPFLVNNFSAGFIKDLMWSVEEQYFQNDEMIMQQQGLYMVFKGNVEILCPLQKSIKFINQIQQGDYYGLKQLFFRDDKFKLKSKGFSVIYFISTENFIKALKSYSDYESYCMIRELVLQENYDHLYLQCEVCKRQGHEACDDIIFKPNKAKVIAKSNHSEYQERKAFRRKEIKFIIHRNYRQVQEVSQKYIADNKKAVKSSFSFDESEMQNGQNFIQSSIQRSQSESFHFDTSRIEERNASDSPINQYRMSKQRNSSVSRKTIVLPTYIQMGQLVQRNSRDSLLFSPKRQTQLQTPKINDFAEQKKSTQLPLNESEDTKIELIFDQMKIYNQFFKQHNYDRVLKDLAQRQRTQRKFRKLHPLIL